MASVVVRTVATAPASAPAPGVPQSGGTRTPTIHPVIVQMAIAANSVRGTANATMPRVPATEAAQQRIAVAPTSSAPGPYGGHAAAADPRSVLAPSAHTSAAVHAASRYSPPC